MVSDLMGHTDTRFTERVYQDAVLDQMGKTTEAVWQLMAGPESET